MHSGSWNIPLPPVNSDASAAERASQGTLEECRATATRRWFVNAVVSAGRPNGRSVRRPAGCEESAAAQRCAGGASRSGLGGDRGHGGCRHAAG